MNKQPRLNMSTHPHLMLEVIEKDGSKHFMNSSIVPNMMEKGYVVSLTGKYKFYPLNIMEEVMKGTMWEEHGIDLDEED